MATKMKDWKEGEMILTFRLRKIFHEKMPFALMQEWLETSTPIFSLGEDEWFHFHYRNVVEKISA